MDVPLLSQDEFFRHLNLQPVHAAAKFHYRHALKERLRASSIALRKERNERLANDLKTSPQQPTTIVETASPCKLLSPASSNRIFGRPIIRKKVRALNFDEVSSALPSVTSSISANGDVTATTKFEFLKGITPSRKPSILTPLFTDSRVFRHPGIKRELEETTKLNGFSSPPNSLMPSVEHPPAKRAKIEVRHCYYPKPKPQVSAVVQKVSDKQKVYRVSVRLQSTSSSEAVEWERKLAAALTLFGHPRKSDVLSTFPYLLLNGSQAVSAASVSGKRSPSLPPALSCPSDIPATLPLKEPALTNGNNNNNSVKDLRLCLAKVTSCSGRLQMSGINLSPTVHLEKLPLLSRINAGVVLSSDLPRGSRPQLHRKAKDEPLAKPPPPPPPSQPSAVTVDKRKVMEVVKPVETSFKCPICRKCFGSAHSLLQHGEQVHLKCQTCGASGKKFNPAALSSRSTFHSSRDYRSPVLKQYWFSVLLSERSFMFT